jgi:branched-subunit amino acid permease
MTGALLVLLFVLMVAVSLWSLVDAALQPEQAYARAGISKGLVTGMLVLTCVVGALFYWPFIRPRLRRQPR